ncbi:MAG TPA: gliding motility-associated C-terminal domain-containing protein [Aequorivita sp.]|nr:gliding motility-associated C-terminal domain-containing protein [Aequorivita sp.]
MTPLNRLQYLLVLFLMLIWGASNSYSQCPTVLDGEQSFCNIPTPLVADLVANDTGGGVRWFSSANSTTPLSNSTPLTHGGIYYAGDTTGVCTTREHVIVTIVGPPVGLNFQGVCVDNPNDATISDLFAIGNDVRWYNTPSGGAPLLPSTVLTDNTIYYADQANPDTGCRTSRLAVYVNVGVVPVSTGSSVQEFCSTQDPVPTVADLVTNNNNNNWYETPTSATPLDTSTPLVDGQSYYATTVDSPCESIERFEVLVVLTPPNDSGEDGSFEVCENDINNSYTINLFDGLGGTPNSNGVWTGPFPTSNGGLGTVNIVGMIIEDSPYVFTYTVSSSVLCDPSSSTVSITIMEGPDAGSDSALELCDTDESVDLFTMLGGTPDVGGTWSPALSSGTGLFDPSVDSPGDYTYTVPGSLPCSSQSAIVTVVVSAMPDAGLDGTVDICSNSGPIDLFSSLGGTPEVGGTWSPALSSGTGIYDPLIDNPGVYTYTVFGTPPCGDDTANVIVTLTQAPDAGLDAILDLCEDDSPVDLFEVLGGTPNPGGEWSPTLSSGTGVFNPQVDSAGVYNYTVSGTSPCADDSATVTISITPAADAGIDGYLGLCETDSPVDLFTILGGTPDSGGTWSPALSSGTGVFDPQVDSAGVYTYEVEGVSPCGNDQANVTVTVFSKPDAGNDGSIELCETDSPVDLFAILGGAPEIGGTWSPALSSGNGIFDPTTDAPGVYTYHVSSSTIFCGDDSATVTVSVTPAADAGLDGFIDLCETDGPIDLFTVLGGTPDIGGVWSPALSSGTGIFDSQVDPPGVYTYTVSGTSPCNDDDSAEVTVSIIPAADAGLDSSLDLCESDNPIDLFTILGGTPDSGGTWSPTLSSGTGIFDPQVDPPGVYTYTVSGTSPCADDSAIVTITITPAADAGLDGFIDLCETDGPIDLFTVLGGTPDTDGVWSPALSSGTGIFDPQVDLAGVYTYTVSGTSPCNDDDSAFIDVTVLTVPNIEGATMYTDDIICINTSVEVEIFEADYLTDGPYNITYELTGANSHMSSVEVIFIDGYTSFSVPSVEISNVGQTTLTVTDLFISGNDCGANVSPIQPIQFKVEAGETPQLVLGGNKFCLADNPTIADLSLNVIDVSQITWYDSPENGNPYSELTPLVDGETYYGSIVSESGCGSKTRIEVKVSIVDCDLQLIIPDGFSPNGDGINDTFEIKNLRELYPNFTMEIYNRYGNILYKGNGDSPDWDGTSSSGMRMGNSELPVGVYFYIINFNQAGKNPVQGRVYLSR